MDVKDKLVTVEELGEAIGRSTAVKTETVTISASGSWNYLTDIQVDVDRVFKVEMDGRWVLFRKRNNNHQLAILRINTSGASLVIDTSDATVTFTLYYI